MKGRVANAKNRHRSRSYNLSLSFHLTSVVLGVVCGGCERPFVDSGVPASVCTNASAAVKAAVVGLRFDSVAASSSRTSLSINENCLLSARPILHPEENRDAIMAALGLCITQSVRSCGGQVQRPSLVSNGSVELWSFSYDWQVNHGVINLIWSLGESNSFDLCVMGYEYR
jgi:hypothetical protein